MKLNPIKQYYINFCATKKTKQKPNFDDKYSSPARLLNIEEPEVIDKYITLKNSRFPRKLTDEEAWVLARPYSIPYADYCERFEDNGYQDLYILEDITRAEIEARKKFKTRFFNNTEIQAFITLKDETDFKSASQIMRYIRLMAKDNGLAMPPTPLEAEYFAKKCTPFDEIKKYFEEKKNNPKLNEIMKKYDFSSFSFRENQIDGRKIILLKTESENEKRYFTFIDGKLTNLSKTNLENKSSINHDSTKRTTSIRTLAQLLIKINKHFIQKI